MPDRWRLGTRNPNTVWSVADEHLIGSFGTEGDARRAVDAVNAQAGETAPEVLHRLGSARGPGWRRTAHCCKEMTRRLAETCDQHSHRWHCPDLLVTGPPESDAYGLWVHDGGSSYIVIRHCPWCGSELPSDEHERSTEHDEDSDESTGSVDGEWVDDPSRSDHPVYECNLDRWCAMCGDPASHKVGEEAPTRVPDNTNDAMIAAGHNLTNWLCCLHFRSVIGDCGDRRTGDDRVNAPRDDPDRTMLPAGSAVGQRGAPSRDALVEAFDEYAGRGALSIDSDALAEVALAALLAGGADTGGESEYASSAERLRRAADALATRAGEWYGSAAVADGINKLVYEARRVAAEPWVPRADGYELCNEPHPDGQHRPCVKTQGHNAHRDGRGDFWESLRTTPDEADIARLATALGVSLDPDDPDPVGRLVEAAGKARDRRQGDDTIVVGVPAVLGPPTPGTDLYSRAWGGTRSADSVADEWREILECGVAAAAWLRRTLPRPVEDDEPALMVELLCALVHDMAAGAAVPLPQEPDSAPAALTVGEVVESAADLDRRASVGTVVQDAGGDYGKRVALSGDQQWNWLDIGDGDLAVSYPVTVVRVGTGGGES